jgi:hypothetical protein
LYLPEHLLPVLMSLKTAQRTPLFSIRSRKGGFARFAWFVRLGRVRPGESELHGLVRLEVREHVGRDAGRMLANLTAFLLPSFAPSRGLDPRSPQNLIPIGALEHKLRRALGDTRLVRRWIETLIIKETVHAHS